MKSYSAKDIINQTFGQIDLMIKQLVKAINSSDKISIKIKDKLQKLGEITYHNLSPVYSEIIDHLPSLPPHKDPIDTFQDILTHFHNPIMSAIKAICNNQLVIDIFGSMRLNHFTQLWDDILTNKVSLKQHAKQYWSLQDIFKDILYPLCHGDRELAWKQYIFSVYSNDYYTGLNFHHENGERIQGEYELLAKPKYTNAYAWDKIQRGDILFSAEGFVVAGHFTGHCAIIDGWYTAKVKGTNETVKYLRIIEANEYGISYGLVDDVRMVKGEVTILHIKAASKEQIESATQFCESQLGKHYNLPIFLSEDTSKDTAAWYCSELVWAAYMNQGINIQENDYYPVDLPGIVPWEVFYSIHAEYVIGLPRADNPNQHFHQKK